MSIDDQIDSLLERRITAINALVDMGFGYTDAADFTKIMEKLDLDPVHMGEKLLAETKR